MTEIVGILLAASFSRRYGAQKLLESFAMNACVAQKSCRNLMVATDRVIAVVRPDQTELANCLSREEAEVAFFQNAHQDKGATLAFAVASTPSVLGWLVALADMPLIQITIIQSLVGELRSGKSVVIPSYLGRRGHPVGFSHLNYESLVQLKGDKGARTVIDKQKEYALMLPVDDAGILFDIDTREDMIRYHLSSVK